MRAGRKRKALVDQAARAARASCARASQPVGTAAEPARSADRRRAAIASSCCAELHELQAKLSTLQGETPLILPSVDAQAVAAVVADWTGIPVGRMVKNEIETVLQPRRQR